MRSSLEFLTAKWLVPIIRVTNSGERELNPYLPHLKEYLPISGISLNRERLCHFLAQVTHESGGFNYSEEIADGSQYEGRRDLGNVQTGDGRRYKGRGLIQLTGRHNYRKYGRLLGIDFEGNPELVKEPRNSVKVAVLYWIAMDLNYWADRGDFERITRAINGGLAGYADRLEWLRAYMNAYDEFIRLSR